MLQWYITGNQRASLDLEVERGVDIVRLGDDDYGLYGRTLRNTFGTPLLCRGTLAQVERAVVEA